MPEFAGLFEGPPPIPPRSMPQSLACGISQHHCAVSDDIMTFVDRAGVTIARRGGLNPEIVQLQSRMLLTRPSQSSPGLYWRTLANSVAVNTRGSESRTNHGATKCAMNAM
jgi:hypothetical protein